MTRNVAWGDVCFVPYYFWRNLIIVCPTFRPFSNSWSTYHFQIIHVTLRISQESQREQWTCRRELAETIPSSSMLTLSILIPLKLLQVFCKGGSSLEAAHTALYTYLDLLRRRKLCRCISVFAPLKSSVCVCNLAGFQGPTRRALFLILHAKKTSRKLEK